MRLRDFEGKKVRLHISLKTVLAERIYWLGGRRISVHYTEGGKRKTGKIFLSWGSGKSLERVKKELEEFIQEKGG